MYINEKKILHLFIFNILKKGVHNKHTNNDLVLVLKSIIAFYFQLNKAEREEFNVQGGGFNY